MTADLAGLGAFGNGAAQEEGRLGGPRGSALREYAMGINAESRRQHKLVSG